MSSLTIICLVYPIMPGVSYYAYESPVFMPGRGRPKCEREMFESLVRYNYKTFRFQILFRRLA